MTTVLVMPVMSNEMKEHFSDCQCNRCLHKRSHLASLTVDYLRKSLKRDYNHIGSRQDFTEIFTNKINIKKVGCGNKQNEKQQLQRERSGSVCLLHPSHHSYKWYTTFGTRMSEVQMS